MVMARFQLSLQHRLLDAPATVLDQGELHLRIAAAIGTDQIRIDVAHHGGNAKGQPAEAQALQIRQLRLQLLHLRQYGLGPVEQHLAAVGQGEAAPRSAQQGLTQLLLHVADHLADGGLGDEQLLGGAGEALLPHQLDEVTQGSDIHGDLLAGDEP